MKTVYIITDIEDNTILVSQEKHLEGLGTKEHSSIEVVNPRKFNVQKGSKVYIGLPKKAEALNGIFSLFVPVICCVIALLVAPTIAKIINKESTELLKFVCVSVAFIASTALVLKLSRSTPTIVKLQITGIAKN